MALKGLKEFYDTSETESGSCDKQALLTAAMEAIFPWQSCRTALSLT